MARVVGASGLAQYPSTPATFSQTPAGVPSLTDPARQHGLSWVILLRFDQGHNGDGKKKACFFTQMTKEGILPRLIGMKLVYLTKWTVQDAVKESDSYCHRVLDYSCNSRISTHQAEALPSALAAS